MSAKVNSFPKHWLQHVLQRFLHMQVLTMQQHECSVVSEALYSGSIIVEAILVVNHVDCNGDELLKRSGVS